MKQFEKIKTICHGEFCDQVGFDELADVFLNQVELIVFGTCCSILEIEFYLCSNDHPDPFVHNDSLQQIFGQWYLHRKGNSLKNGSFKGIDLTLGTNGSFFGVLIRSIQAEGQVVCGPCLCVDFMIRAGGHDSIHELDSAISSAKIWTADNPIHFAEKVEGNDVARAASPQTIYTSPRVGLSKVHDTPIHADFGQRGYRYLVSPRDIKKGRPEMIRGLFKSGHSHQEIKQLTGSPMKSIEKYAI